jgi:hypothetical protein
MSTIIKNLFEKIAAETNESADKKTENNTEKKVTENKTKEVNPEPKIEDEKVEPKIEDEKVEPKIEEETEAKDEIDTIVDDMSDEEVGATLRETIKEEEIEKAAFYRGIVSVLASSEDELLKTAKEFQEKNGKDLITVLYENNLEKIAKTTESLHKVYVKKASEESISRDSFTKEQLEFIEKQSAEDKAVIIDNILYKEASLDANFAVGMESMNSLLGQNNAEFIKQAAKEENLSPLEAVQTMVSANADKISKLANQFTDVQVKNVIEKVAEFLTAHKEVGHHGSGSVSRKGFEKGDDIAEVVPNLRAVLKHKLKQKNYKNTKSYVK